MILLYRQLELARAKAVIKIAELTKAYEAVSKDTYWNDCDVQEDGKKISSLFDDRLRYENFCHNIDTLQKEITCLTKAEIIKIKDILHIIRNCRQLELGTCGMMSNFYLGNGKWLEYKYSTPLGDMSVFSDAGLVLLNEWESRLDNCHQRLHLEGHSFSLDEFFRHLLPEENPCNFMLENEENKSKVNTLEDIDVNEADESLKSEKNDEYLCGPMAEAFYRISHIRMKRFRYWGRVEKRITGLIIGASIGFLLVTVLIVLFKHKEHDDIQGQRAIITDKSDKDYSYEALSFITKGNDEKKRIIKLEQEVQSLKEQIYVLQQASGKHDNALIELGMER